MPDGPATVLPADISRRVDRRGAESTPSQSANVLHRVFLLALLASSILTCVFHSWRSPLYLHERVTGKDRHDRHAAITGTLPGLLAAMLTDGRTSSTEPITQQRAGEDAGRRPWPPVPAETDRRTDAGTEPAPTATPALAPRRRVAEGHENECDDRRNPGLPTGSSGAPSPSSVGQSVSSSACRRAIRASFGSMDVMTAANRTSAQPTEMVRCTPTSIRAAAETGVMAA